MTCRRLEQCVRGEDDDDNAADDDDDDDDGQGRRSSIADVIIITIANVIDVLIAFFLGASALSLSKALSPRR